MRYNVCTLITAVFALTCAAGCALLPPPPPSKGPVVAPPGDLSALIKEIDRAWQYCIFDTMRRHPGSITKSGVSVTAVLRPTSLYTYELNRVENVQGDPERRAVDAVVTAVRNTVSRFRLNAPMADEKAEVKFTFHYQYKPEPVP